jgi:saccharopine dehydrogenase-like NADP-dependent oxidoreductase
MLCMLSMVAAVVGLPPDVLVVGGNGRVGASTVRWLDKLSHRAEAPLRLAIGGRSPDGFEATRARLKEQGVRAELSFVRVDLDGGLEQLAAAVAGTSLVVHTAGPFQQRTEPTLLKAALSAGVPYCDVCDELELSRNARALAPEAERLGVPCVVSCGIWPGVSALMAAEAVAQLGGKGACERLEFSFYTAGTGGAGPTIVSATFLLLATEVVTYVDGKLTSREPWTERRVASFGDGIGEHECFLLDNPDVPTTAEALGVPNAASRFGTAPSVWNGKAGLWHAAQTRWSWLGTLVAWDARGCG